MDVMDVSGWLGRLSQQSRFITIDAAVVYALIVERFDGHEAVNQGSASSSIASAPRPSSIFRP